ncbi:hypothetical protein FQA39_LY02371 [Lamprigera yunnana]|nr:hypothetical protein FQA39_LY02371 [Lamprigera yunnana]
MSAAVRTFSSLKSLSLPQYRSYSKLDIARSTMENIQIVTWFLLISVGVANCLTVIDSEPPKPWQKTLMARYVVHQSDWVSISTISTLKAVSTYPYVNLKSMSDGPISQSSGVPYLLMTHLDVSGKDLENDNRCSILASLAETNYCKQEDLDPQDPRCSRVILTGHFLKVDPSSAEYKIAKNALYSRHPHMKKWPIKHNFYIGKVDIEFIALLDNFGGIEFIDPQDYFHANVTNLEYLTCLNEVKIVEMALNYGNTNKNIGLGCLPINYDKTIQSLQTDYFNNDENIDINNCKTILLGDDVPDRYGINTPGNANIENITTKDHYLTFDSNLLQDQKSCESSSCKKTQATITIIMRMILSMGKPY